MNTIKDTQQITSDKSTFLIDIVKTDAGKLYVEIGQSINTSNERLTIGKINPEILSDLVASLQHCHSIINVATTLDNIHLDNAQSAKFQSYYCKNIPIKTIAKQLNLSERLVIDSLR